MRKLAVCFSVLLVSVTSHAAEVKRELVILLLVDAMRSDHLGAYGYTKPTSPEMDKLAGEGTRYAHAFVNAPWTRPSTVSYLTGMNASRHKTESAKSKLPENVTTVAQRLTTAGWATAGFTANGNGGSLAGLQKGFQKFEDPTTTYTKDARGVTYNNLPQGPFIVDRVLGHLAGSKASKQFVFVFLVDPHDPYGAPPELEEQFLGKNYKGVVRRKASWEVNNDYPAEERFSMQAIYDAGIRNADIAIGQLVEGLKKQGVWNDTTMFITADHGEAFGEHGVYLHAHHFYDEILHVPVIAHGSRFKPGVEQRWIQAIDLPKTVLDIANVKADDLPGQSLLAKSPKEEHIISEYNEFGIHRQAILGEGVKVIWQRPADEEEFMKEVREKRFFPSVVFDCEKVRAFDEVADPAEKKDILPPLSGKAEALLNELKQFVGAPSYPACAAKAGTD
ncbi:MAG: sulfatase [Clostridia bacterium]|nr:sulfatase [Deltaproteobacteria bacterium]